MDRRDYHRVQLRLPARLRWTTPFGQKTEVCTTVDVSRAGMLVPCREPHAEGMPLWVTFPFDSSLIVGQPEVLARVVRSVVVVRDEVAGAMKKNGNGNGNANGNGHSNGNGHHKNGNGNGHKSGNGNGNGHHHGGDATFRSPSATDAAAAESARGASELHAQSDAEPASGARDAAVTVETEFLTLLALRF